MLQIQRIEKIKSILREKKSMTLSELEETIGISRSTVYRDVLILKKDGFLTVSGGFVSILHDNRSDAFQSDYARLALQQNITKMESIASMALTLIEQVDSIFIGESLVCYLLAQKIKLQPRLKNITVVTNNFNVALELSSYIKHLYLIGGELLHNIENLYTGGPKFASNLSSIFVNKAFASIDGVDINVGYTMQDLSQLNILSHLPSFAATSIFLVTSSKFGCRSVHQLAPLDFADIIISDDELAEEHARAFSALQKPRLILSPLSLR